MLGQSGEKIYKYTTSTPWNFSSWTNSGKSYNLIHRIDSDGLAFSSDGLTMYILSGTQVVEVPLETAWSPETAYTGVISVSGEDSAPVSLCKTSDGLNLYMLGDTGNDINRYTLSPANKINTATFVNALVHSTDNTATGITCNSTASTFWITGPTNDRIYQVANSGSSGALGSFTQTTNIDISKHDNIPNDVFLSSNGNYLYFTGQQYDGVYKINLTTANTLIGYDQRKLDISSQTTSPISITRNSGCDILFVNDVNLLLQYDLSSPNGSLNGGSYSLKYLYIAAVTGGATTPEDMHLSRDEKTLYILDSGSDSVKSYGLRFK
jgi:sugar lactone lactonase YvrE